MKIITGYTGAQHIQSADDASYNCGIATPNNVVLNTGNKLSAQLMSNNIIRIGSGDILYNGRHARIETYEDVKIQNGVQGMNRVDAIVARYRKDDVTGLETITLQVVKGGSAFAPILDGDMLLYNVKLTGANITGVTAKFHVMLSIQELKELVDSNMNALLEELTAVNNSLLKISSTNRTELSNRIDVINTELSRSINNAVNITRSETEQARKDLSNQITGTAGQIRSELANVRGELLDRIMSYHK